MKEHRKPSVIHEGDRCLVVVAHPDDETLWAGGFILLHPDVDWTVLTLTRASDHDRAPKFYRAMKELGAKGIMGDLDDGPEQQPLKSGDIQKTIIDLLGSDSYDIIITHSLWGEYTRHVRHEEAAKAVGQLRDGGQIVSRELWRFAYEDGDKKYLPKAVVDADIICNLPEDVWRKKYEIITEIYGFSPENFEAKTTPRKEAFWLFG
ncbi:MAG: PIG-L family deacetylase [Sedimentisphaerales bacterium]|nr:PIG-L family deacetylase [Sedimentisphaerales bacterium]